MTSTTSQNFSGTSHWNWTHAFYKHGFGDGIGRIETLQVLGVLRMAGYEADGEDWGCHNTVITTIRKRGQELIPYDNPEYRFGYDDPLAYFPEELIRFLDEKLPRRK